MSELEELKEEVKRAREAEDEWRARVVILDTLILEFEERLDRAEKGRTIYREIALETNHHTHDVHGDTWFRDVDEEFEKRSKEAS